MGKRYVVTGPTGAIGTALIERLLRDGAEVYAVVRPDSPRKSAVPVSEHVHIVGRDIKNLRDIADIIDNACDAFFHLAWQAPAGPGRNDMYLQENNIKCAIDACEAAHDLHCSSFILAGSQMEYGRHDEPLKPDTPCFPENGYGMAKLCAEEMTGFLAEKYGMTAPHPRILSIYGPRDGGSMVMSTIRKLLAGEPCAFTKGEQIWDFLYSEDAAEILYLLTEKGISRKVYPVGSGDARPLRSYIEEIRDIVSPGVPLDFGAVPYGENQIMYLSADTSAVEEDLDFKPRYSFADGVRKTAESLK